MRLEDTMQISQLPSSQKQSKVSVSLWQGQMGWRLQETAQMTQLHCLGLLVSFFLSFFLIFLLLTIKNRYYICYIGLERVMGLAATKMGPNDAQSIVWAISEFFFFFLIFLLLTITIRYYVCYKGMESVMGARSEEHTSELQSPA